MAERRGLLIVVIVALAAATGLAQPASAPQGGPASPAPNPRPPLPDLSPQAQAKDAPAFRFTAPSFDPWEAELGLLAKNDRATRLAVRRLSGSTAPPRPRIVCGTRIIEVDGSLDPKMVRHPESNPDPRIARPAPPPCGPTAPR